MTAPVKWWRASQPHAQDIVITVSAELTEVLGTEFPLQLIRSTVEQAVSDLNECATDDSLAEMAYRLARVRLESAVGRADA